jgi:hypothetical protein
MFTTPRRATLPIFTNYDSKPDTGTTLAIFATLTQFQTCEQTLALVVRGLPECEQRGSSSSNRRS